MPHNEIGLVIKQAREAKKLTQKDVSNALGYASAQFISNWERNLSLPPKDKLRKLSEVVGLKFERLKSLYIEALANKIK